MKTFRIHLKDGKSFTVTAHHFAWLDTHKITFYKNEKDEDTDILVLTSELVAIHPLEGSPVRSGSTSSQMV